MRILPTTLLLTVTALSALAVDFRDPSESERLVGLSGDWRFSIGDDLDWAEPDFDDSDWSEINVPDAWENEGYRGYSGFAWYRRTFSFREDNDSIETYLVLGEIDDVDEVWVNGKRVGSTGRFPPNYITAYDRQRAYRLPAGLLSNDRRNTIAVRVYDGASDGGIRRGPIGIYTTNLPLPEIDLHGEWLFAVGDNADWAEAEADESDFDPIQVPGYWENDGYDHHDGFGWYRTHFSANPPSSRETMVLLLGKIDDTDEVYLNGTKIGSTGHLTDADRYSNNSYYAENRSYFFPSSLLRENNVLAVRVHDHDGLGGIYESPLGIMEQSAFVEYWETRRYHREGGYSGLRRLISRWD